MIKEHIVKHIKAEVIMGAGGGDILREWETYVKLVKKITDWIPAGVRTKERVKNRRGDEVINYLKKLN